MKRPVLVLFFLFILYHLSFGVSILFITPKNPSLSVYAQQMLNGLKLSLMEGINIIEIDSSQPYIDAIASYKPEIIVGPFLNTNVKRLVNIACNKQLYVLLPFSKDTDNCSNVFFLGYDPMQATKELANEICNGPYYHIGVFYSYNRLNTTEKEEFLKDIAVCGKTTSLVFGIPSFFNVMDQFIKDVFGVRKVKKFSGLTEGSVFSYSLHLDTLVIFAPTDIFSHLLDLIDYYDINPGTIYTQDLHPDQNILSMRLRILKRVKIVTPYYMCGKSLLFSNFLSNYRTNFFEDPTQISALGFDLGTLINWILTKGSIVGFEDKDLLEGHFLFFDDRNDGVFEYKILSYKELKRCKQQILNK